ncbi:MAG: N-acetylglucosamine-6-phosphate deacetylase [Pelagibacterium sp. SCN 63-23]|nr:MAG: N-acetylglucosamine-6-phosphate deacetylase [Pelagibacterium sp. SCN 63-23]
MTQVVSGRWPETGETVAIEIVEGRIASIQPASAAATHYVAAGLIDLQINGFAGHDLNDGKVTPETVGALCRTLLSLGVTAFLPTIITASEASIIAALGAIAAARRADPIALAMIPGIHVEGPSIGREDGPRGAHPLAHVRPPSLDEFARWQQACGDLVSMVTLSPDYPEAPAYITELARRGVHVAIGHTGASAEEVHAAIAAGASLSTHLGNGSAAMLPRHPNFLWAQLAADALTATFIADGFHLPADTLKAMLRAKGLERSVLVSDVVALGGMPAGRYANPIGGMVDVRADGRIGVADTPYLAGAGLPLAANVALAIRLAGLSLSQALALASTNPGRFCGRAGTLAIGAPADLICFDWHEGADSLTIRQTFLAGQQVFSR